MNIYFTAYQKIWLLTTSKIFLKNIYLILKKNSSSSKRKKLVIEKIESPKKQKSQNKKFSEIKSVMMLICDIISNYGNKKFEQNLFFFKKIGNQLRNNNQIMIEDSNQKNCIFYLLPTIYIFFS